MPRPNPGRMMQGEENVRRRIAYERERRGWSYEATAARLNGVGCPLQTTAVHKIEKGRPPRRITVDELHGFAAAFGMSPADLLVPVEQAEDAQLRDLLREMAGTRRRIRELAAESYRLDREVAEHLHERGYSRERLKQVQASAEVDADLYYDEEQAEELLSFINLTGLTMGMSRERLDGTIETWGAPR